MSKITRDSLMMGEQPLSEGEVLIASYQADTSTYWRNHTILAAVFSLGAMVALWFAGNPHIWVGPLAAIPTVYLRAAYLKSEAFADRWRLVGPSKHKPSRLMGPRGQSVPLAQIKEVKPLFGDVLVLTLSGDKHLVKYPKDPQALTREINQARGLRG